MNDNRNPDLREELTTCKQFLVDSQLVRGRQHVINYASNYIDPTFLKDKLQKTVEKFTVCGKN